MKPAVRPFYSRSANSYCQNPGLYSAAQMAKKQNDLVFLNTLFHHCIIVFYIPT